MWPGVNKFNLNPLLTFFDIFHPLTYSPTPLPPLILSLHPLTPFSPGRPERETTITFHQRLSQYYSSTSSKRDGGYWSQSKRQVEIARECVCVRVCECVSVCVVQQRAETTDRDRESVQCGLHSQSDSQSLRYGCLKLWATPSYPSYSHFLWRSTVFLPRVNHLPVSLTFVHTVHHLNPFSHH